MATRFKPQDYYNETKKGTKETLPVENQSTEGLSVHILSHNDQRLALLVGNLQGRNNALDGGDLLHAQQQVGVLELTLLAWREREGGEGYSCNKRQHYQECYYCNRIYFEANLKDTHYL